MNVCCEYCFQSLLRADHSSRGVLPTAVRRCMWSRNLKEWGGHSPRWGTTPPGGGFGNTCQNYSINCCLYLQCRTLERRKNTTPNDTTHFTRYIWSRSLRIIKIGTCLCSYSLQNVNSYETCTWDGSKSHSYITTLWVYACHFYVFLNFNTVIPRLPKIIRSGITFVSRNVISRRFL